MASLRSQCAAGSFRKSWGSLMNIIIPLAVTITRGRQEKCWAACALRCRIYFMLCHWCPVEPLPGHFSPVPFFSISSQSVENRKLFHYPCAKEFFLETLALAGIWPGKTLGEIIAVSISVSSKELCEVICTVWAEGTHLTDLWKCLYLIFPSFFPSRPPSFCRAKEILLNKMIQSSGKQHVV